MISQSIVQQIASAAEQLDAAQQQRVLEFIRTMAIRPQGNRPADILSLAGAVSPEDCMEMQKAIEEGCGQVDPDGW